MEKYIVGGEIKIQMQIQKKVQMQVRVQIQIQIGEVHVVGKYTKGEHFSHWSQCNFSSYWPLKEFQGSKDQNPQAPLMTIS